MSWLDTYAAVDGMQAANVGLTVEVSRLRHDNAMLRRQRDALGDAHDAWIAERRELHAMGVSQSHTCRELRHRLDDQAELVNALRRKVARLESERDTWRAKAEGIAVR